MEGTYPLPEAQVDRFMFNLQVKYPTIDEEVAIIKSTTSTVTAQADCVLQKEELHKLHDLVRGVPIADDVVRYTARLVHASRPDLGQRVETIHKYISYGASPRASQYLVLGAKARAILDSRYHVDFADVRVVAHPVLRHRLIVNFHARADQIYTDRLIDRLLEAVPQEEKKK